MQPHNYTANRILNAKKLVFDAKEKKNAKMLNAKQHTVWKSTFAPISKF